MALIKQTLQEEIAKGLKDIYARRVAKATSGDEQEDPMQVIEELSQDVSNVLSNAIDKYIKSGDIYVKGENVIVTSPMGACTVTPAMPAKVE